MFDLMRFRLRDTIECAARVRRLGEEARDLEDLCSRTARFLDEGLLDADTSRHACALVRVYKTSPYSRLDPVRRAFADAFCEGAQPAADTVCLSLMATSGELSTRE